MLRLKFGIFYLFILRSEILTTNLLEKKIKIVDRLLLFQEINDYLRVNVSLQCTRVYSVQDKN
jgi:hypothetical protein